MVFVLIVVNWVRLIFMSNGFETLFALFLGVLVGVYACPPSICNKINYSIMVLFVHL